MAKSLFKVGVGIAKSVNREIAKSKRESAKRQRQIAMYEREERRIIRERAKLKKIGDGIALLQAKYSLQAEIDDAKKAYVNRCEERKLLRKQFISKELK